MYSLQTRWRLEGKWLVYYGLRNKKNLFRNRIKLNKRQQTIIQMLPASLDSRQLSLLGGLVGVQVVKGEEVKPLPTSLEEAVFCTDCAANNFIIPGLEFDENGRCPLCQTKADTAELKSLLPIQNTFPHATKSRFDIAVFYTGGKDSTYLLYYLAKVLRLRVLALTWEIPYMSDTARRSIENAKQRFDTVEFITRCVSHADLKTVYRRLYQLSGNTCACPSLAYVLFYPELVENRVPYFVAGNEPAQVVGLYYNGMAPKFAYRFAESKWLPFLINVGRVLTLHPPLKKGQFHTLTTMKQLAYGDNFFKTLFGYKNELVSHVTEAIHSVPAMVAPLKRAIRRSSRNGNIPAFVQVDFNAISGGQYDWRQIKDVIIRECGWVEPPDTDKGLHTSCSIEKCKEYTQFLRFYNMETQMIPFSALELALASRDRHLTREQAIAELKNSLGFSLQEPHECEIMRSYFE